jgi:putative ABC transport system permease protein
VNLLALKMLLGDRLKYLGLVVGIAFASLLITQQASIFYGYAHRIGAWIRDTGPADLWVMDPQAEYTEDQKPLTDTTLQRVRSVDGVAWATPMWKGYLPVRLRDGTLVQARIVGIDDATLLGGPPRMVEGELADLQRDRAVFVDRQSLADLRTRRATADGPPTASTSTTSTPSSPAPSIARRSSSGTRCCTRPTAARWRWRRGRASS